jgi:hypothetical protein
MQRGQVRRFPARRWRALSPGVGDVLQHGQRAGGDPRGAWPAHLRPAEVQFVLQVVPAVAGHDVEKQQRAADDPGFGAGRRAGQGDDQIRRRHQRGNLVGEAERPDPRRCPGQFADPAFHRPVTSRHGEYVHPGSGQPGHAAGQRAEAPATVDQQHARVLGGDTQIQPGLLLRRSVVERRPHRWRHDPDRRPGQVAADGRGGRRGGDQEQVSALGHPEPVHGHVGAQHHGRPGGRLGLERCCRRRPGGEHAEHQVGRFPRQIHPQRRDQPGPGATVHQLGQPAPGPQVREVQPVVDPGRRDETAEHAVGHPGAPAAQQGHAVQIPGLPPGLMQQAGAAARHHLVAEPHRPGQQHCVRRSGLPVGPAVRSAFDTRLRSAHGGVSPAGDGLVTRHTHLMCGAGVRFRRDRRALRRLACCAFFWFTPAR